MSTPDKIAASQQAALVTSAVRKQSRGETLTKAELAAWKRWEDEQTTTRGAAFVSKVPQRVYRQWAGGRQTKQLQDHERAYGIPCASKTIDIPAVIRWVHDFLVSRKEELSTLKGGSSLKDRLTQKQIEQLELRIEKLSRERDIQLGQLTPTDQIEEWLGEKAKILRALGEWFEKQPTLSGREAAEQMRQALTDARVDESFAASSVRTSRNPQGEVPHLGQAAAVENDAGMG